MEDRVVQRLEYRYTTWIEMPTHLEIYLTREGFDWCVQRLSDAEVGRKRYWEAHQELKLHYVGRPLELAQEQLRYRNSISLTSPLDIWYDLIEEATEWYCLTEWDRARLGALTGNPFLIAKNELDEEGLLDIDRLRNVWIFVTYEWEDPLEILTENYGNVLRLKKIFIYGEKGEITV